MRYILCLLLLLIAVPRSAVQTWKSVADPSNGGKLHVLYANKGVLYAGGIGHVWKSSDAGATWSEVGSGLPANGVVSLSTAPDGSLVAGTVRGVSAAGAYRLGLGVWTPATGLTSPNLKVSGFAVAYGRLFLCTAFNGDVWASDDNGASYTLYAPNSAVRQPGTTAGALWTIGTTPDGTLCVSGEQGDGIWLDARSIGAAWKTIGPLDRDGYSANTKQWLLARSGNVYAARKFQSTGQWMHRLVNGKWEHVSQGLPTYQVCTALCEDASGALWCSSQDTSGNGSVYSSKDGVTWQQAADGLSGNYAAQLVSAGDSVFLLGAKGGLLKFPAQTTQPQPPIPAPVPQPIPQPILGPSTYQIDVYPGPRALTAALLACKDGTTIRVHAGTYNEKPFIYKNNIVLEGIPDELGHKPLIDGTGQKFDPAYPIRAGYNYDFMSANAVVLIGRANTAPWGTAPMGNTVRNLEITGGPNGVYLWNSATTTVDNCLIRDCGQALFASGNDRNDDLTVVDSEMRGNGVVGSYRQHNGAYTECNRIRFTRCHIHSPKPGMLGAALKDRSSNPDYDNPDSPYNGVPGTIIEDCVIEEGARSLDLVEPQEAFARLGPCRETVLRGNTFVQTNAGGSKLVHFGDDQSSSGTDPNLRPHPERSRQHITFTANSVRVRRDGKVGRYFVLFENTSNDQKVDCSGLTLDVGSQTSGLSAPAVSWIMDYGLVTTNKPVSNVKIGTAVRVPANPGSVVVH